MLDLEKEIRKRKRDKIMAATQIDPKTALVTIDLQKGIVSPPTAHPVEGVLKNAGALAEAFRAHHLPVVLVHVSGMTPGRTEKPLMSGQPPADWTEMVPELHEQPSDHIVTKQTWGAFSNTLLAEYLKAQGVTQVVVAGISTSIGVESTARSAYELGFNVTLAVDAMTDTDADAHENSVTRIFPKLGETGTTAEIVALLGS